nr:hypothetical protein [Tanacetum cinerariifolium]
MFSKLCEKIHAANPEYKYFQLNHLRVNANIMDRFIGVDESRLCLPVYGSDVYIHHPITILSDPNVEDAFSSTYSPDYTSASLDYFPALPGNTSSNPSKDLSKYLLASLAISPFHDDPYIKVMQAYNATSNESLIPPQVPIAPPTVLSLSLVLPPSLDS